MQSQAASLCGRSVVAGSSSTNKRQNRRNASAAPSQATRKVTSMVATGPRLPKPIGGDTGGDEPLRISLGEGMMANIFIGSLIFIEELAEKIVGAVAPVRDSLDACLIFPSMPAVMKLNKLGSFSMSQLGGGGKSAIGEFMKNMRQQNDNFEEQLLKLVRTLPKVLKFLPSDKAQDARNYLFPDVGLWHPRAPHMYEDLKEYLNW
ncbi:hypothetical protein CHLNCDRAFT_143922 [Chlorella variabilis]|uniref:magnesium chelatase n=1 Tax=Chlorella variabilis TaxID=554065 RepID=E1ZAR2_CHLVA|nr:hypothetical protein CHLNCDRAFT_143922 [Chlorella variabilis]EFN57308.1 hypothetical protein CHLNCDRAFT_143922 [Chlorella variabilis]|eukprot:XP_005849410.1 hypothetical protein CHLNCDRAFT_143922 [Chlorella variabilis]